MIRQTKAGTWEVDHYFFDSDGKRRRRLRTFTKHKDAVAYQKEALAAVQKGEFVALLDAPAAIQVPLKKLFGPCVYVVKEAGADLVLYVGMSTKGVSRIGDYGHHVIEAMRARENIIVSVIFAEDANAAIRLETALILKHRPEFNSRVDLKPIKRRRLVDTNPKMRYAYTYHENKSNVDVGRRDLGAVPNPGDTGEDIGLGNHRPVDGGLSR
jgi:Arm DNA-binding domain